MEAQGGTNELPTAPSIHTASGPALDQETEAPLVVHSGFCSLVSKSCSVLDEGSQQPEAAQPRRLGAIRA